MKRLGVIMGLWLLGTTCFGQSLDDLRKKKESAAEQIRYTNQLLEKVTENQQVTLSKLRLINNQISQRNQLIHTMNDEISLLQTLINDNTLVVEILTADLAEIKKEYAEMVRFAYKNRNAYDQILFFLSAENFNQAYRRFVYVKQYTEYRKKQALLITSLQDILARKLVDLENQKQSRRLVMNEKEQERQKLQSEKQQQNSVVQKLQSQQRDLRNKLNQQRQVEQQLEREIQRIIEEEARKAGKTGQSGFALTPEQKLVGANFEQNKRRLPWPVERGVITEQFGVHPHPVLKNVTVRNNGVNIATQPGSKARAVFNGEVSRVFGITGGNMAVIIRHGQYLSVYSNLVDVTVKKGDKVNIRQQIGTVFTDTSDGNKAILKFQIWQESQKLDPEEWLSR